MMVLHCLDEIGSTMLEPLLVEARAATGGSTSAD